MMQPIPVDTVSTGIEGLDEVLHGGVPRGRIHLIQGNIGTGKTTLGLSFVLAGVKKGESCLYVTLAENESEIHAIASSHGWSLEELHLLDGSVSEPLEEMQTVLHPAEIELPRRIESVLEHVEALKPERLVIDSLSDFRILAREPHWFRRELVRLRNRLSRLDCTVLLLDTVRTSQDAESLLGGLIRLEREVPSYGPDRRRLHVTKMRGHVYQTGHHDMRLATGGLQVYPRLIAANHRFNSFEPETLSTGLSRLDDMLGGGLDRGTAILLFGPTGSGKSTLGLQCVTAAARRGERGTIYVFDERIQTVMQRAQSLGLELEELLDAGRLTIRQMDPAEVTPGQFAEEVRREVEENGIEFLLIDSLNAYLYAMPEEKLLNVHLHELLAFLSEHSVTSLLIGAEHGGGVAFQNHTLNDLDVSYLADTVLLHKIFEHEGELRKALTVYKRRAGPHESRVRELRFESGKISIGEALALSATADEQTDERGGA